MAQQSQLDPELIRQIIASSFPQESQFDPTKITQAAISGLDLADTIQARRRAQEDRERALATKIEEIKRQKTLAQSIGQGKLPPNITPEIAEAASLETPSVAGKEVLENIFAVQRSSDRIPRGAQFVGTRGGQGITFDPNTGTFKETPLPSGEGEIQPRIAPTIPTSQLEEANRLADAHRQLLSIKTLTAPENIGPIQSRLKDFAQATGINTPTLRGFLDITDENVKFQAVLQSTINDYIKAITGAQMSEQEARRIMKALPNRGSADEAFLPALRTIIKITEDKIANRRRVLKAAGFRNIDAIFEAEKSAPINFTPEKVARLTELRAKKAAGTLR